MNYQLPKRIMENRRLNPSDKLIYMIIKDHIESNEKKITNRDIAEATGLTEMTVNRSIKRLVDEFEILVNKDMYHRKYYSLVDIYG